MIQSVLSQVLQPVQLFMLDTIKKVVLLPNESVLDSLALSETCIPQRNRVDYGNAGGLVIIGQLFAFKIFGTHMF